MEGHRNEQQVDSEVAKKFNSSAVLRSYEISVFIYFHIYYKKSMIIAILSWAAQELSSTIWK
jgi:hypothetical protein